MYQCMEIWMDGWSNHEESSSFLTTVEDISQAFHRDSTTWTPGKARRLQKNQDFHFQEQLYNFLTARIQRTSSEIRGHLLIRHWQHAGHRTVAAPKNVLLEQGSPADLDHVQLLDVVVPQHGGGELGSKHRVVARPAQHQVGSVHWNKGWCALCALLCTGNWGYVHFCALKQEFGHDNGGVLGHRVSLKSSLKHFGGSQKGKRQLLYFVQ